MWLCKLQQYSYFMETFYQKCWRKCHDLRKAFDQDVLTLIKHTYDWIDNKLLEYYLDTMKLEERCILYKVSNIIGETVDKEKQQKECETSYVYLCILPLHISRNNWRLIA